MISSDLRLLAVLELLVMTFQVFGVAALCLSRLMPGNRWAYRGRAGFIVAMVGLGVAGALCGRHDSEFALFAGLTMTVLFIGMISGSTPIDTSRQVRECSGAEANLAV